LEHSKESKDMRERVYGAMHSKTIDSYQQLAKLLSVSYVDYEGVITPQIQRDLQTAINCYERVFKYMKANRQPLSKKSGCMKSSQNSILLSLTRTLVGLKLRLIPSRHKEVLLALRKEPRAYPEEILKESILRLVHLTPTVYLEEVYQRLNDGEASAVDDLGAILQIAESPNVNLA
jgi:hypothetical protein